MSSIDRPYATLAETVRQARLGKGMSQRRLSELLGKSDGYLGHLESGRFRPTAETLKDLAAALDLPYGQMAMAAEYISAEEFENPLDDRQLARLHEVEDLTDDEWNSAKDFMRYIRSRRHP